MDETQDLRRKRAADQIPMDAQAIADRTAAGRLAGTLKDANQRAGAAIADVATLVPRGLAGAYDTAVVRPMRAAGINAGYMSPLLAPEGSNPASQTPFYDQIRARDAAQATPPATPGPVQTSALASPAVAQPAAVQLAALPPGAVASPASASASALLPAMANNAEMTGYMPASGTGAIRNNSTGAVSMLSSGAGQFTGNPAARYSGGEGGAGQGISNVPASLRNDNPTRGFQPGPTRQGGGIFSQMSNFVAGQQARADEAVAMRRSNAAQRMANEDVRIGEGLITGRANRERQALESTGIAMDNTAKANIADLQSKIQFGTPEEKGSAEQTLRAMQGKYEKSAQEKLTVVPQFSPDGTPINPMVLNSEGKPLNAAKPDAAAVKAQAEAALKANPANKAEINKRLAAAGYSLL